MNRTTIACTLITLSVTASVALGQSTPFTHTVVIPADSGSTIRFEKAKLVNIPTRIASTADPSYCQELVFRDPGGSMFCPYVHNGSAVAAYEVTYSYSGDALASAEAGSRNFSFQVYFRTDELPAPVRHAIAENKQDRAELAAYFKLSVFREPLQRNVIDEAKSHLCTGNFVDGVWTPNNADCKDEIYTTSVASPSNYITVRVDPGSVRAGL